MDFQLSKEEEAFRDEVRAFLDENLPEGAKRTPELMASWNRKVREKRWVGFSWPKEVGGGGGSIMEQVILKDEMARRKAPALGTCFMGLAWVGPAIVQYGTEEQKQKYIPEILDGKYQWCTGYSEPDSGSDLASLKCKGVREGDEYVVNGQKIWTSIAMWSKMMILLVRTDFDVETKHDGITCLLVDMETPGIEVRPIKNMSGGAMFAEVFFDDVRVPVGNRLGEEGEGWRVTISALASERSSIAEVHGLIRKIDELKALARKTVRGGRPMSEDPGIRRRLAQAETKIEAMRLNGMRFLTKQLKGEPLGSETSINKLHRASLEIGMGELALEILGSSSTLMSGDAPTVDDGSWAKFSLNWPEVVIGGGTPNIQRNIIAERILGLPKD
ncbi:MAG: acyl-CoA dehydrogenase family protein [Deltaproteobacteria bacterium]|jgi:alkylation response protein AidB-like acyl-CoA dehydrogenase|nr:acyl-CoA dehydrogenase family protein [Deltaproteobacteria bacterium]MBW2499813.1 acyl-CoA dehydrogenase family protein [Deltaproteobacteria bacterium]